MLLIHGFIEAMVAIESQESRLLGQAIHLYTLFRFSPPAPPPEHRYLIQCGTLSNSQLTLADDQRYRKILRYNTDGVGVFDLSMHNLQ